MSECHRKKMEKKFANGGTESALRYIQHVTFGSQTSGECHTLMHALGRVSYLAEPDIIVHLQKSLGYCTGGYLHGALEEYLLVVPPGELEVRASTTCSSLTELGLSTRSFECLHGLGHALMYAYDNELMLSLKACDSIVEEWAQKICYFGVFMENSYEHIGANRYVGPTTIQYIDENNPIYPCNSVEKKYQSSCYSFPGNSYLLEQIKKRGLIFKGLTYDDYRNAFAVCLSVKEEEYRLRCIRGITVYIYITHPKNVAHQRGVCELLADTEERAVCFQHLARMINRYDTKNTGRAKNFCTSLEATFQDACVDAYENWWYESLDKGTMNGSDSYDTYPFAEFDWK